MSSKTFARWWLVLTIVGCTLSCDRLTKELATTNLRDAAPRSYLNDTVRLQYVENEGAFLGMGSELDATIRFWLLTVASGIMLLMIFYWIWRDRRMRLGDTLALSLLVGGGVGNLADRIFMDGRVVDFLNIGVGTLRTGIFNVADVAIMLGVSLLTLRLLTDRKGHKELTEDRMQSTSWHG
jgi:signal peptidase II